MKVLGGILIFAVLLVVGAYFALNLFAWGRITGPPTAKDFEAIAREGQPIAQAICDYRSDHGLLPEKWSDIVPAYLSHQPKGWDLAGEYLGHFSGLPHTDVAIRFDDNSPSQWHLNGEYGKNQIINVPGPIIKPSSLPADGLFASRLAEFEKRISTHPRETYYYRDKIAFAVFYKSNDLAIAECERAAKLFPNWWFPPMALAELRTNDTSAELNFHPWVDAHPTFINYWYLSRLYRERDDHDAAFAALEQAAESTFISQAAEVADLQNQIRLAAQGKLTKPVADDEDDAFWNSDGFAQDAIRFCCENRKYELALKIIRHCSNPDDTGTLMSQAAAELGLGRFDAAIADAQKSAQLGGPQSGAAWILPQFLQEAQAHNTNFWSEPEADDRDWTLFPQPPEIPSTPDDTAENAMRRAFQHERLGNLDASIADCTKVIELQPLYFHAYNLRSWSEFLKNDFDASIADASRAIRLNLNYGNAYGTRGWARYGKGDSAGALEDLNTAIKIAGARSLEAIEDQGLVEFINGHFPAAIKSWQKAIEKEPSLERELQPWIEKATQHANN